MGGEFKILTLVSDLISGLGTNTGLDHQMGETSPLSSFDGKENQCFQDPLPKAPTFSEPKWNYLFNQGFGVFSWEKTASKKSCVGPSLDPDTTELPRGLDQIFSSPAQDFREGPLPSSCFNGDCQDGQRLKADNPIHELISIESELFPQDTAYSYAMVNYILGETRERVQRKETFWKSFVGSELPPDVKLRTVYEVMRDMGIKYRAMHHLLPGQKLFRLDCDTSSYIVLAVAHEMGWPVHGVTSPKHFFVRWDDGKGTRFNMDFGVSESDDHYKEWLFISPEAVDNGVYLKNLSREELKSEFLAIRCGTKAEQGDMTGALADCNKALRLYPQNTMAYSFRSFALKKMGLKEMAFGDYTSIARLDPYDNLPWVEMTLYLLDQGRFNEALEAVEVAHNLAPDDPAPLLYRAMVKAAAGKSKEAHEGFTQLIDLFWKEHLGSSNYYTGPQETASLLPLDGSIDTDLFLFAAYAYRERGLLNVKEGEWPESDYLMALGLYNQVLNQDPKNAVGYMDRGSLNLEWAKYLENHSRKEEALIYYQAAKTDLDKAILKTKDPLAFRLRSEANKKLGLFLEAQSDEHSAFSLSRHP